MDHSRPERVLVVTAHPDDADFGVAGTVASLSAAGAEVTYCVCTDGQAGGFDPTLPRNRIPDIRRAEQRDAAVVAGVQDVRFLGYVDGALEVGQSLIRDLVRTIRQVRPQRLISHSPERWWDQLAISHPDHLAAGEATVRAAYPFARNPFAFPELLEEEGLTEWTVEELWLFGDPRPNTYVDITARIDTKLAAILSHRSQMPNPAEVDVAIRATTAEYATEGGLPVGSYAESFRVHPIG